MPEYHTVPMHTIGDLVVAVRVCDRSDHGLAGRVATVARLSRPGGQVAYGLLCPEVGPYVEWAWLVRHPTPEELAAHQLSQGVSGG